MRQANTSHVFLRQTKKSQLEPNSKRSNPTSFQAKPVELAKNPNESKFNCEICGKFLCDKSGLRRHLEARHLKIRKNSCDHCDYSSIQKNQLISHILRKHFYPTINKKSIYDEKRPIPCDYRGCRKRFFTKPELKQHQRSHSGEHEDSISSQSFKKGFFQMLDHSSVRAVQPTSARVISNCIKEGCTNKNKKAKLWVFRF